LKTFFWLCDVYFRLIPYLCFVLKNVYYNDYKKNHTNIFLTIGDKKQNKTKYNKILTHIVRNGFVRTRWMYSSEYIRISSTDISMVIIYRKNIPRYVPVQLRLLTFDAIDFSSHKHFCIISPERFVCLLFLTIVYNLTSDVDLWWPGYHRN